MVLVGAFRVLIGYDANGSVLSEKLLCPAQVGTYTAGSTEGRNQEPFHAELFPEGIERLSFFAKIQADRDSDQTDRSIEKLDPASRIDSLEFIFRAEASEFLMVQNGVSELI